MKKMTLPATCALILTLCAPAQAAVLSFNLSDLADTFQVQGPVSGGFTFDTDTMAFAGVEFKTDLDTYTGATASIVDGTGFGLPSSVFLFQTAMTTFFFGLDAFDAAVSGIGVGEQLTFDSVFAFESDEVTPDLQIGLNGAFAFYAGDITITRLEDPVAPIPLPASLPLMIAGLGGLGFVASRRGKSRV